MVNMTWPLVYIGCMSQERELRIQLYVALGMSLKEAIIYDLLLHRGEMQARAIELETGYKKNTYVLIKNLEKMGMVLRQEKGKRIFYQPLPPNNLINLASRQVKAAQRQASILAEMLPGLTSAYAQSVDRPMVRYVEGEEGFRELYKTVYNQDIPASYGCLDLEKEEKLVPEYMGRELIPERVRRGSRAYAVLANNVLGEQVAKRDSEELRESILVDPTEYPLPAEVSVYGDKVALLAFKRGGMTGVLIENKEIAKSLESVYRLLFRLWRERGGASKKIGK